MKKYTKENKKLEKLLKKATLSNDELWQMVDVVIAATSQTAKHFCRLYDGYNIFSDHAYDQKDRLLEAIGFDMYNSLNGNICPNMIVRTDVWKGLETDLMEMSMQDVSGWKHPKACTWASYMAGWETPYGVYLSPVEVGPLSAPEDSCLLLSDGRDTAQIDLGDAYLSYAFEGITEDGIVNPIRILDASEVKWGSRRKVRLSNKVIEEVIERVETQFNRSIR